MRQSEAGSQEARNWLAPDFGLVADLVSISGSIDRQLEIGTALRGERFAERDFRGVNPLLQLGIRDRSNV